LPDSHSQRSQSFYQKKDNRTLDIGILGVTQRWVNPYKKIVIITGSLFFGFIYGKNLVAKQERFKINKINV